MCVVHARDYDHWRDQGAEGWGFADILPYFLRMEDWHDGGHGGDPAWRGKGGPLHVTRGARDNPLVRAFVEAGREAGYPVTGDYNGEQQEGFGPFEMTVWKGSRWSAAKAYLTPALKTGNCTVIRGHANRVVIEEGRAKGVEITRGRCLGSDPCPFRGDPGRLFDQFAQAFDAFGHRSCRPSGRARHRSYRRQTERWSEPARPS